jgi:MinD-like ATPase involved in chromosome partitioning or flagellar assembly
MTLVALVSAKGAPGVTTLAVALAALTPGAVVADLDSDGGDLALRYRREDGNPLDLDQGLLSLAATLRRDPNDYSPSGPIDRHLQITGGGLEVLLGVKGPDQAIGLGPPLWSSLARALAESGRTIFADCGRIGPASPVLPVLAAADAVIIVARAELEELSHLRERLRFLTATLPTQYSGQSQVGVVLVATERDRAAGPRTEQLLRSSRVAVPVLGTITDDPRGAERLRGLAGGRAGRTMLVRSVRSLLPAVRALTGELDGVRVRPNQWPREGAERPHRAAEPNPFTEPEFLAEPAEPVEPPAAGSSPYRPADPYPDDTTGLDDSVDADPAALNDSADPIDPDDQADLELLDEIPASAAPNRGD